jgi:cytochrome c biogenesis protein CcmG/thiol:disulfide interchange protein DsbE
MPAARDHAEKEASGRRRPRLIFLLLGVLLAAALAAVLLALRASGTSTASGTAVVSAGRPAPRFALPALDGARKKVGVPVDGGGGGRPAVLLFFASWCPPCQEEEPALVDFAFRQSRVRSGARMVSVVFNDTLSDARRFVADWGIRWPVVPDSEGAIANRYGVGSPPMTFLVDPSGVVVGTWVGPVTVTQLDQMLAAARRGELVSGGAGGAND